MSAKPESKQRVTPEQSRKLAEEVSEIAHALTEYVKPPSPLTNAELKEVLTQQTKLFLLANELEDKAISLELQDAKKDFALISAATRDAKKAVKTIKTVKSVVAIATQVVALAVAIGKGSLKGTLEAGENLVKLAEQLTEEDKKK